MTTLFAILILLGIAIIFHEFGHFIVAKMFGIRVEQFSLGFPPRLFGIKVGETDYCVSATLLGGYVKVTGQDPSEELTGAEYEFNSRPPWQRILVVLAGPVMNMITAYFLLVMILMVGVPTQIPLVDSITPNFPAEVAGIKPGDRIVSANHENIQSTDQLSEIFAKHPGETVPLTLMRDKTLVNASIQVPKDWESVGIDFAIPAVIGIVQPNKPAARAGLQPDDVIVSINGEATDGRWQKVSKIIRAGKGTPLNLVIRRNGQLLSSMTITPEYSKEEKAALIGITPKIDSGLVIRYPIGESLTRAAYAFQREVFLIFYGLYKVGHGDIPMKEAFGGPQTIVNIAGQSMKLGLAQFLSFVSMISITLGIMNLLPIPVLDGGHILFHIIEWIRGKGLSPKTWEVATKFGFAILLTLMTFVIINDFISSGVISRIMNHFQ